MLAKIISVCVVLFIVLIVMPSFVIGLVIWLNFVHYIFFEPSRNERGEIDECIGCNVRDCEKCKWKDLIDKENGGNGGNER